MTTSQHENERLGYARITVTVERCEGSTEPRKFELDAWTWRCQRHVIEWIVGKEVDAMVEALQ